ncbi:hypothetical protein BaRGS_00030612 [Batillaria attramentaria]|uniref:Endothelin-converting enzyme 1 n=1 Tax=Batillaria attramentaria TaxID=370345 RepID=A0ABD0JU46_9CAEN
MEGRSNPFYTESSNTIFESDQRNLFAKKSWTRRSKCLLIAAVICFLVAVAFFAAFLVVFLSNDSTSVGNNGGSTEDPALVSSKLDTSVDPCDDFYEFACGKWRESQTLAADQIQRTFFTAAAQESSDILREALRQNDPTAPEAVLKTRMFFRSCENTDAIEERGPRPLKELLQSKGGNTIFPTMNPDWTDEKFSFTELVERVGSVGGLQAYSKILTLLGANETTATQDAADVISFEIALAKILQSLPETYDKITLRNMTESYPQFDWLGHLQRQFREVNISITEDEQVVNRAPDYFQELFSLLRDTPQRTLLNYGMWRIVWSFAHLVNKELRDVKQRLTQSLGGTTHSQERWEVEEMIINLFEAFKDLLTEADWMSDTTKQAAIEKVMTVVLLVSVKRAADEKVMIVVMLVSVKRAADEKVMIVVMLVSVKRAAIEKVMTVVLLVSVKRAAIEKVMTVVLLVSVKRAAIEKVMTVVLLVSVKRAAIEKVMTVVLLVSVKRAAIEKVMTVVLLVSVKRAADEKADYMHYKVGYPESIMNNSWLNENLKEYSFSEDKYFENAISILVGSELESLKQLRRPVDLKGIWAYGAATVNAGYLRQLNEIEFPAAILVPPVFSDQFPDSLNHGGLGALIGHEITHGYDNKGAQYDKYGNQAPWWHPEDKEKFINKARCMKEQYSKFRDPVLGMKVAGSLTLGENIADNGGLKEAYRAYRNAIDKRGKEEAKLPVLPYTPDQLFFIGFGQMWCAKIRDKFRALALRSDNHSPARFRVLGTLQNNPDFSRVFNCSTGSPMNPSEKCHVW